MSIGIGTALAIGGIAAGVGGAVASTSAAGTQAAAANNATITQAQEAQNALDFQQQEWQTQQTNEAPFLQAGQQSIGNIQSELAQGNNGPFAPWTGQFTAPTAEEAAQTPGYQFQLQQGEQSLQNSAAANGGLLTGGTLKGIDQYSQGLASTNYQNTYQNALTQYQSAYNTFQNNQANLFNRQASVAGIGQTTAGQLGSQGQAAASNAGNISVNLGQQIGNNLQNAGAATASGYVGAANSLTSGVNGITGAITLQNLLAGQTGGYNAPFYGPTDQQLGYDPTGGGV